MEVKKSKNAAIENRRGTWLLMGLVVVLSFMFVTFEWTQRDVKVATGSLAQDPIFEQTLVPITYLEAKPLPPPPPPVQTVAELLTIVDNDEADSEADFSGLEDLGQKVDIKYIAPEVNKDDEVKESEIFVRAEVMPQFPGGDGVLLQYLAKHINYPTYAQEVGIQGRVIVQFVVDKDGTITDPVVVKSVDPSLDKEAIRVITSMPKWNPGMQRNKPVRVKYTLPVTFRLQ